MVRWSVTASVALLTLAVFQAAPARAGFDCSKFARNDDGSWHVVQALEIKGPHGRIDFTPNETYTEGHEKMGLDIAKLLNANCVKK
jgi:hypothetical protein